ncbi:histone-like nucleoid-structuring protein Lsr2 [Mycolicibacterium llatzerense]|uniref:histone-like nucleoid-structuring protein Lsr2 n=1 Tax=Mycolicibacterium llatzerense TaxID=280871 RepID=UPI0008DE3DD8|nr:Lsr2 family protein [Mycolicibacterium llatzerense]
MAERIVRQLIDDLDGAEIPDGRGERIPFALRGVEYQIDLSTANGAKLDKALKPFIDAAQKVGRTRRKSAGGGRRSSAEQLAEIRAWARKNGYEVSGRGRIRAEIVDAFHAEH